MTKRGLFLDLDWKGEGVVGLGLKLGVELGLGTELDNLEFCLERVGDGEGEGEGEGEDEVVLVKKAVIWRCWFTIGDRPLLWRRDDAIVI